MLCCAMEEFSFDAPINATVIFEDSDDETIETKQFLDDMKNEFETKNNSSKTIHNSEIKENQINSDLSKDRRDINKVENKNKKRSKSKINECKDLQNNQESNGCKKRAKERIIKQKSLDMPSLEEEDISPHDINCSVREVDSFKELNTHLKKDHQTNKRKKESTVIQTISKRRHTHDSQPISIERRPKDTQLDADEDINVKEIRVQNLCETQTNRNSNGNQGALDVSNTEKSLSKSLKQNMEPKECFSVNIESNRKLIQNFNKEQTNPDTSILSDSLNESNQSVVNYIKELLNTVSEHMIYIINSYQSYVRIQKTSCDPSLIENAKNNFIRTRNHFFDLSYSSVVNIIIPRNDDATFVENFIKNTTQIAVSKSLNYYSGVIKPLYLDMIDWVKKRREAIQNMNLNKLSCPLVAEQLQKPPMRPTTHLNHYRQTCKPSSTFTESQIVNSSVPPHQNIYMEQTLNNQIGNKQANCPCVQLESQNLLTFNKPPPPYPNQDRQLNKSRKTLNENVIQPSRPPAQNMPHHYNPTYCNTQDGGIQPLCSVIIPPLNMRTNYESQFYDKQANDNSHLYYNIQKKNIRALENMTYQKNINVTQQLPPFASQSWQRQTTHTQSWQNDWATTPSLPLGNQQEMDLWPTNQHFRTEKTQTEPNRSISRDSGFISPLNFNGSSDQPCSLQEEVSSPTPLITHVTSLNPNVSYITDGYCAVCGKTTKQKCIGCYKCYYCSHGCQFLDWKNHQMVCK